MSRAHNYVQYLAFLPNLFTCIEGFWRPRNHKGWVWISGHHCWGPHSLMFIAWELKCSESFWECHWSRKERTSLVPTASYIQHLKQLCHIPVILEATRPLCLNMKKLPECKKRPRELILLQAVQSVTVFLEALCNQSSINMKTKQ